MSERLRKNCVPTASPCRSTDRDFHVSRRCPPYDFGAAGFRLVHGSSGPGQPNGALRLVPNLVIGEIAEDRADEQEDDDRKAGRVARASRFGSAVQTRKAATSLAIWSTVCGVPSA